MNTEMNYLIEEEAAAYLRISPQTLRRWRSVGRGPAYHKIGGAVRYRLADLDTFAVAMGGVE